MLDLFSHRNKSRVLLIAALILLNHLGLIAQEVEPLMPEMVEKGADASAPLGMNYNNLIPVLVNAIKQQQQQISALRREKAALDVRLAALEMRTERRAHTRHRRTGSTS